jgi:hypothetical protein
MAPPPRLTALTRRLAALRAPAAIVDAAFERDIKDGAIDARLASGD